MKTHARNFVAFIALIAVVYIITNYTGEIQQQIGVKGASTVRGQNIAGHISNDVGSQVDAAKNQAMHVSLSDIMNYFNRFKRVPQDINTLKNFIQSQTSTMLKSTDNKK